MKERTKRLQALFCALAVTATSVGSPLVSVPVYAEDTQGAEDTSEQPETESGKTTDASDNAISESPDQAEEPVELIPENPNQEPAAEDEEDSGQETTVEAETAQMPQAAAVQEAQTQEAETVTPKEGTLTVKINGTAASGESLETAVTASGTEAAAVTRLELVSGTITQADLAYITTLTNLQDFHMQLGSGLKLIGKTGSATTVLGKNTAVLNFAPKASGSSKGALRSVELGGVTEILTGGIVSDSVETISMPDVVNVGMNAFKGFGWLESVSLPKAETIGSSAFFNCTRMTSITLESVKTLKASSFENTNSLTKLTLPATIQTIENIKFGTVRQGNKAGTRLVMKGMTPPKVTKGAFSRISQSKISTVTVPAGALDAYLNQANAGTTSAGLIGKQKTMWNSLYLREEGSCAVEYYNEYDTNAQVAYVKAGETVPVEKVPAPEKEGYLFKGWNTKKDGTGESFGVGSTVTEDLTVYPIYAEVTNVNIYQQDGSVATIQVEKGQAIGDNLPTAPTKEGYLFTGWNTKEDGTGDEVTAETVINGEINLYPQWEENLPDVIKGLVNGISVDGSSLEDAIKDSKVAVADVTSIELVSGEITQNDLAYLAQITNLEKFTMHLGEDLILHGKDGNPATVLGPNSAVLNFAPKAAGSSKGELREVHLEGVTEIQKGGIVSDSVEIVDLPDATEVGDDAFNGFGWLEKVSLPKAETIGMRAFYKCTRLTDVTLEAVKTLKKDSFYYTNSLKRLTLPATLETIENIQFGRVGQGNKAGTRVVMKGMTPPTVASGAFTGVSQTTISTVTVPAGALDAYLAQINAENSSAGLIRKKETMWNNLYLREEGSYAVEYYSEYVTGVKVAYVKAGEGVTAEKVASATKAGNIFKGWNTKKNGTGEAFGEGSVPTRDLTVYPVFAASCTVQIHQEDGTTTTLEVEKDQAIGEKLPTAPEKEGYVFKEWNTSADGTGTTVTADTIITANMDIYPVYEENLPDVIKVLVNGISVDGSSLEDAIKDSKVAVADVTSIELVSGEITQNDLAYLAQITNLEKFTMHLGEDLILHGKDGNPATVLGPNSAVLNFAPKAAGSSKGELREVHLEGVTEIQKGGIVSDSVEIVDLPDATEVGDDAFNGFGWLEKVSLPKAETIGMRAFYKCTRLTDVTLEAVKTLKKDSFYYTNSLKRLTLPATLETIENIQFGRVGQGNKAGTRVVMKGMTPPTVASGAFTGVSQTTISTVTVPAGALDAYLAQINAENSSAGLIRKKETMWNNLYLREEGSYAVEYYSEYVTGVKVAYVKAGEGVTAEKVASATKAGNIFKGWNTKKNGTGEAFGEGSVPTDDITVYPVFAAACTIQIHQEDGTTTKLEVEKGQAIRENLPVAPTKEGYLFKGWNTSADGTGTTVTADTVITENMDLYPIFEEDIPPVVEVRVVFDVDGQKSEVKVVKGEAIGSNLPADPEKDGYTFKGWNTKADGTGETVTAETVVTDEMEVYAVFEQNPAPIEEVRVVFDVDGVKSEVKVIKGEAIGSNLPADPTKDGYTFKGWNTKADGTGETVTAETVVTDEMEVYAVFEQNPAPIEEVKVVIDVDGVKTEVKVIKGEAIGSNLPADPTKDGYTFKGWNTKADGTGETVTAETVVTDEMEVYAVFEQNPAPIEEVKVVFDVDGVKTEVKVIKGEVIGSNLPADPTKDGYTFKGWNTKADGTGEAVTAETVVTDEMEVYAVFEQNPAPIEEVKVVINVDGVKSEVKVIKGEAIGSNLPADPTKKGYTFKGWNTKADGTGETVTADTVVSDDLEVYAIFEKTETPKDPEKPDPGKGDDTKKPETPTPTPTPTTTPTNTNTTKKNNTTTGTTTPASKTTTTAQTAKTVKTADATPLASTAAAGGLSLLGILAALFGKKKK